MTTPLHQFLTRATAENNPRVLQQNPSSLRMIFHTKYFPNNYPIFGLLSLCYTPTLWHTSGSMVSLPPSISGEVFVSPFERDYKEKGQENGILSITYYRL